jgi:GGDEF domain-containing protein
VDEEDDTPVLPDRSRLVEELAGALRRGQRPAVVAVALRDLDGLRAEDPAAADVAVAAAGRRLSRLVRSSDLVAAGDHGRFLVAGSGVADDHVDVLVDRILGAIAFPCEAGNRVLSLVADIGWATPGSDAPTAEALVAAAEDHLGRQRP